MPNATLKDVAQAAGVSPSTVSLVLNKKGHISPDVCERVAAAARQLQYTKTPAARLSKRKYAGHLTVLIFEDPKKRFIWNFFRRIIVPLEMTLTPQGYYPMILPVSWHDETADIFEKIIGTRPKAVFSLDYGNAELFRLLEEHDIPVVLVNNSSFQTQFSTVCVDDFHGAYEGTTYLLAAGHTRLAYLEYDRPEMTALLNDRFIGFKKALAERNIPFADEARLTVDLFNRDELQRQLHTLFRRPNPPTAIFAHDDFFAAQILIVLQQFGLRVPADVSLLAPGDVLDYDYPYIPPITTMRINNELMGKFAAEMLLERLQHPESPLHVLKVNQQLVERGSCRQITSAE